MADDKEMYLRLARETEKAIRILVEAQQVCEEIYLSGPEKNIVPLTPSSPYGP